MDAVTVSLLPSLLSLYLKASVLLAGALVADRALRSAPAHTRHTLWTGAFAILLALPILSAVLPALPIPSFGLLQGGAAQVNAALSEQPAEALAAADPSVGAGHRQPFVQSAGETGAALPPAAHSRAASLANLVSRLRFVAVPASVTVWLLGTLLALTMLAVSCGRARHLIARAGEFLDVDWRTDLRLSRVLLGMRLAVRLRSSDQIQTPMAGGLRRGTVLVPTDARTWSAERRRFVLLHELVHLERRDPVRHLVARLAMALYWVNPLAWAAARRALAAREAACDERVIELGATPSRYARQLVDIHAALQSPHLAPAGVLPLVQRSLIEERVMNILRRSRRPLQQPVAIVLVAGACLATLGVAAAQPQEAPPKPPVSIVVTVPPAPAPPAPTIPVRIVVPALPAAPAPLVAPDGPASDLLPPVVAPQVAGEPPVTASLAPAAPAPVVPIGVPVVSGAVVISHPNMPQGSACMHDLRGNFSGRSSSSTDGDGGTTIYERMGTVNGNLVFVKRTDDVTLCAQSHGDVEIDLDTPEVFRIGRGGIVYLETSTGDRTEQLEVRGDGSEPIWHVNGERRPYDAAARAWQSSMLETVGAYWQVAHLRGKVATKRGEIASVRGRQASLRGRIASARGEVASKRGRIASVRGEAASLRGQVSSVRGHASSLRGQIASEHGAIASLRSRRMYADDDELEAISARIERHESRIAEIEEELAAYDVDGRVAAIEERLGARDIEGQVAEVERDIRDYDLNGRVAEIEGEIQELDVEGEVRRIEAEIEALNADETIERLERTVEAAVTRLERAIEAIR